MNITSIRQNSFSIPLCLKERIEYAAAEYRKWLDNPDRPTWRYTEIVRFVRLHLPTRFVGYFKSRCQSLGIFSFDVETLLADARKGR